MREIVMRLSTMKKAEAERVASLLSDEFVNAGRKVTIVIYENCVDYELNREVKVIALEQKYGKLRRIAGLVGDIRSICRERNDNVILMPMLDAILSHTAAVSALSGIPFIAREANSFESRCKTLKDKISYFWPFFLAKKIAVQTETIRDFFPEYLQKKICVINNPVQIPSEEWKPQVCRRAVCFGRLFESKNFPLMLDAFAIVKNNIPEAELYIYGEGELRKDLEDKAETLGLSDSVFFPGVTEEVASAMRNAAVFVSSSDYEGLSNSMLEAMAIGMPVVCTDCDGGGARWAIGDNERGLLVPKGNAEKLAEAIEKMMIDREFAYRKGISAREFCRELDPAKTAARWLEIIKKMD